MTDKDVTQDIVKLEIDNKKLTVVRVDDPVTMLICAEILLGYRLKVGKFGTGHSMVADLQHMNIGVDKLSEYDACIVPIDYVYVGGAINIAFPSTKLSMQLYDKRVEDVYQLKSPSYSEIASGLIDALSSASYLGRIVRVRRMNKPSHDVLGTEWQKIIDHVRKGGGVVILSPIPVITITLLKKFKTLKKFGIIKDLRQKGEVGIGLPKSRAMAEELIANGWMLFTRRLEHTFARNAIVKATSGAQRKTVLQQWDTFAKQMSFIRSIEDLSSGVVEVWSNEMSAAMSALSQEVRDGNNSKQSQEIPDVKTPLIAFVDIYGGNRRDSEDIRGPYYDKAESVDPAKSSLLRLWLRLGERLGKVPNGAIDVEAIEEDNLPIKFVGVIVDEYQQYCKELKESFKNEDLVSLMKWNTPQELWSVPYLDYEVYNLTPHIHNIKKEILVTSLFDPVAGAGAYWLAKYLLSLPPFSSIPTINDADVDSLVVRTLAAQQGV
jgi:hypothetical protein